MLLLGCQDPLLLLFLFLRLFLLRHLGCFHPRTSSRLHSPGRGFGLTRFVAPSIPTAHLTLSLACLPASSPLAPPAASLASPLGCLTGLSDLVKCLKPDSRPAARLPARVCGSCSCLYPPACILRRRHSTGTSPGARTPPHSCFSFLPRGVPPCAPRTWYLRNLSQSGHLDAPSAGNLVPAALALTWNTAAALRLFPGLPACSRLCVVSRNPLTLPKALH